MGRHVVTVLIIWAVLTAIGYAAFFAEPFLYPVIGSDEAKDFDEIFDLLIWMGMPVLTFVFAVLGYTMLQFSHRGPDAPTDDEAGATIYGRGAAPLVWVAVTSALALAVMYPGLHGLQKLQAKAKGQGWGSLEGDYIVHVQAQRFSWSYHYFQGPECEERELRAKLITTKEGGQAIPIKEGDCTLFAEVRPIGGDALVIPVEKETKFEIHSIDVIHSFWIPAFRTKIDTIPGRVTYMTVKPDKLGGWVDGTGDDSAYRVQCAELCGIDHTVMKTPVQVVDQASFDEWVKSRQQAGKK